MIGTRLGPYEIVALLGAGGMGEVYQATDSRLGRAVAIKVLPPEVSADPDRRARFEREARTVGALSHPNIVAIHDVGTADGVTFLVMELLEGETLRARLTSALPLRKALDIATHVAQGLAAAHARGIVHRDLKPENIFLTTDGRVKVLDFGLARAIATGLQEAETRTTPAHVEGAITAPGMVLGTAGYMAPEQVRGRDADQRSDIFALGAVLFEMLTGTRAFKAESAIETMSAILSQDPLEQRDIAGRIPANLEPLVRHCLEKQPDERFQSARDLAFQLQALANGSTASGPAAVVAVPATRARRVVPVIAAIAAVVALLLVSGAFAVGRWTAPGPEIVDVGLPDNAPIGFVDSTAWAAEWPALAVSPSGAFVVYVARVGGDAELWYRSLKTDEARRLPGTKGAYQPVLSPDERTVAFFVGGLMKTVGIDGATPAIPVAEVTEPYGAIWYRANEILVSASFNTRFERVEVNTGRTSLLAAAGCALPTRLPDDRGVVCTASGIPQVLKMLLFGGSNAAEASVRDITSIANDATPMAGGNQKLIGNLLIWVTNDGELAAATFDATTGRAGAPTVVQRDVRRSGIWMSAHFDITTAGDLVYVPGRNASIGQFVVKGTDESVRVLPIEPKQHLNFAVSPNGKSLAVNSVGVAGTMEMWIYDIASGKGDRVAAGMILGPPVWRPDGTLIFTQTAKRGDPADLAVIEPMKGNKRSTLPSFPIDPAYFVDQMTLVGTFDRDIAVANLGSTPRITNRLRLPENQYNPIVSQDRQWLAYAGAENGVTNVYVTPFAALDNTFKISTDGGSEPMFLTNDDSLVYRVGTSWYRAAHTSSTPPYAPPRLYWTDAALLNTSGRSNAEMLDGGFVYLRSVAPPTGGYIRIVRGWLDKVRGMVR